MHPTIERGANENIAGPPILDGPCSPELPEPSNSVSVPLSDLWAAISNSRYRSLGGELERDVFEELQEALSAHAELFSSPFSRSHLSVHPYFAHEGVDDQDDFGIEIPDGDHPSYVPMRSKLTPEHPTYPWPNKALFITTLLFSSPRLPFSEPQMKAVLDWAKVLGARDVPSLYALKQHHKYLQDVVGDPTRKVVSPYGNIFYVNDIANAIAKDYANPLTRFAMQDFPEDGGDGMSQVFHGEKLLRELPSPPAARVDGTIYFVDELLQDSSGGYFVPERFFLAMSDVALGGATHGMERRKELYALGRSVERTDAGFVVNDYQEILPTSAFKRLFEDIAFDPNELACGLTESSKKYASLTPNPWRKKSGGRMVYRVPLIIFMDDVSGNISKQWNKHFVIYMSNASLPREMLDQEFNVRFVTSSPHASPMELMHAMKESVMQAAESGVIAWDCRDQEEVLLIPEGLFHAGDNPMQAELCSQAGLTCNFFCRTCHVGGTKEYKGSDSGYRTIFEPGSLRTPAETMSGIRSQLSKAMLPGATDKVKTSVSSTGVRDTLSSTILHTLIEMGKRLRKRGASTMNESDVKKELEKELATLLNGHGLEDMINPLLGMPGVNIHLDTPTEILHTVLLGVVKYFWGQTVFLIEKAKLLDVFQSRLDSIEHDALNAPSLNAKYMCGYKGSLIGKHFKSLAQVMPFVIYDLVPQDVVNAWTTVGQLVVLLWHTEITNLEVYLAKLSRMIEDFLNVTAKCAPSILISKPKFHFLVHLPAYIRRFGPAIAFSTERFESFNYVFRLSCIHSSRHGPSQDSCQRFARLDIVKHIVTGGYWYEKELKRWVRASPFVLDYLYEHPAQAKLLGVKLDDDEDKSGTGEFCRVNKSGKSEVSKSVKWESTLCAKFSTVSPQACKSEYHRGHAFIAKEGDKVEIGGHVILAHSSSHTGFVIGRVCEILIGDPLGRIVSHVATQLFTFAPELHPLLHLPCVELSDETVVVHPSDILCGVNLQHNCIDAKCTKLVNRAIQQERTLTQRTKRIIQHEPTPKYFLNTFSIHNYSLIRAVVPPSLQEPPPRVLPVDVDKVRTLAAQQIRQKKAQHQGQLDVGTGVPQEGSASDALAHPAFDQPVAKKNTRKRGAKNPPTAASNATQPTAAPSVILPPLPPQEGSASDALACPAFDQPVAKKNTRKRGANPPPTAASNVTQPPAAPSVMPLPPPPPAVMIPSIVPSLPTAVATHSLRSHPHPAQMQHDHFSPPSTALQHPSMYSQPHHQPLEGSSLHSAQIQYNYSSPPSESAAHSLMYHRLHQLPPQGSHSAVYSAQMQYNHSSPPSAAHSLMYHRLPPQAFHSHPAETQYNGPMHPPPGPLIVPHQPYDQLPLQMRSSQLTDPRYHMGFPQYASGALYFP
ncbi:hypothetical protein L210DRAFT_3616068 [Boletus edulis BED1]|uniref:Uncharacterized protein n=1 Tax=Boletus edulis BED1 TaxID=1328754 RepID=A0AAD4G688_BOLED|nr:hypothetical protein L210DRAFT_3616068 [Boletus edulis BED1]